MNEALLIPAFVFLLIAVIAMAFYWGWTAAVTHYHVGDIMKYVSEKFPTQWQSYKTGIKEGYAQGLRDGQETHNEPS